MQPLVKIAVLLLDIGNGSQVKMAWESSQGIEHLVESSYQVTEENGIFLGIEEPIAHTEAERCY